MIHFLQHAASRLRLAPRWAPLGCLGLILVSCGKTPNDAEKSNVPVQSKSKGVASVASNSTPEVVQVQRSVFSTNVDEGRDPFFPESTRRSPRLAGSQPPAAGPAQPGSHFLKLTGLWPSKRRPLALINRTSIAPGEEANITVFVSNGQNVPESRKLLVRCLEVRQNSVLISIDGEPGTKELILQTKL
ncbi:MAG: hypothetical protein L0Z50_18280 [Verrucomicrobiales bacterium]|nr:hypothetical protein [Verrucomicrobiales bacterium]